MGEAEISSCEPSLRVDLATRLLHSSKSGTHQPQQSDQLGRQNVDDILVNRRLQSGRAFEQLLEAGMGEAENFALLGRFEADRTRAVGYEPQLADRSHWSNRDALRSVLCRGRQPAQYQDVHVITALAVAYLLTGIVRVDLANFEDFADLVFVDPLGGRGADAGRMWVIARVCSVAPSVSLRLTPPPLRQLRMETQLAADQAATRTVCLYGLLACALRVKNRTTPSWQPVARQPQYTRLAR